MRRRSAMRSPASGPAGSYGQTCGHRLDGTDASGNCIVTYDAIPTDVPASAYTWTTDNNQITAFHPGAMQSAHETRVPERIDIDIAIVAPDGRQAMLERLARSEERR